MIERFWPIGANLEAHLDLGLEKINDVVRSAEVLRYDFKVISELCWWLDEWWKLQKWNHSELEAYPPTRSTKVIFAAIERQLTDRLSAAFPGLHPAEIIWEEREAFLLALPLAEQLSVRSAVAPVVDDAISRDIADHMKQVRVSDLLNIRELHRMLRPGVKIILNGLTPTPFTRNLSAYNVWLTKVATSLPNVRFLQGRIECVERGPNGQSTVMFDRTRREVFDRVLTRYGPSGSSQARLTEGTLRDHYPGDILLANPHYLLPDKKVTNGDTSEQLVELAQDQVHKRIDRIRRRRGHNPEDPLSKPLYLSMLFAMESYPFVTDPRYIDPQRALSAALKTGRCPAYHDRQIPQE